MNPRRHLGGGTLKGIACRREHPSARGTGLSPPSPTGTSARSDRSARSPCRSPSLPSLQAKKGPVSPCPLPWYRLGSPALCRCWHGPCVPRLARQHGGEFGSGAGPPALGLCGGSERSWGSSLAPQGHSSVPRSPGRGSYRGVRGAFGRRLRPLGVKVLGVSWF